MSNYEKSGRTFIAYKGRDYTENDIVRKLREKCPSYYTVKTINRNEKGVIFSKVVYDNYSRSILEFTN